MGNALILLVRVHWCNCSGKKNWECPVKMKLSIFNKTMSKCLSHLEKLLHVVAGRHTQRFYCTSAFKNRELPKVSIGKVTQ